MKLSIVILAAGKGKRMATDLPKVLHQLGGLSLLERVVNTVQTLNPHKVYVVYGNGGGRVQRELNHLPVEWVEQAQQLGTGHAVLQAVPRCDDDEQLLVLYGDVPLISSDTLNSLLHTTPHDCLGVLVTDMPDPSGLGRIIRNDSGHIINIVEERDADDQQRKIREVNTGILTCPARFLKHWLPQLKNKNHQQEYYLTDIVALAVDAGVAVLGVRDDCAQEMQGVNNLWQLATLERYYQYTMARQLAMSGVQVMDPHRLDIRGNDVIVEADAVLDVNVILEGVVRIGAHSKIGPNVILRDVTIGKHVEIKANTVIENSTIADQCSVGPFARIRPGTVLDKQAKIGNFVETKKTTIGVASKINHLSYVGDSTVGRQVNIGAGVITCNYDGVNKWHTEIGDKAFIGSNTALIAPLKVGEQATVGAGSTLSRDVPAQKLTVARAATKTLENWQRPADKKTTG